MQNFHPFVIPFFIGFVSFFVVVIIKYTRWISQFDRLQRKTVQKNIFSWRLFPAIWEMIRECLFHRNIFRHNLVLGYMHSSIALGWLALMVFSKIESWLYFDTFFSRPWMGIFYRYFAIDGHKFPGSVFLTNLMDFILIFILSGIFIAVVKRVYSRLVGMKKTTKHVIFDQFALYALWILFPARLIAESATAGLHHNGGFITQTMGDLMGTQVAGVIQLPFFWLYSLSLMVFLIALPFSRYMHIPTEIFLIYFRRLGVLEGEKSSGFTKLELSACSRCGICIDGCPLNSELDINNVQSVYFLRDIRYKRLKEEVADNCLMCNRCVEDCPVGIELTQIRRQKRDKHELDTHDNYKFIESVHSFNAIGRVIYFAGCMSHLTPSIIESMKKIFDAVGQKYWFMDEDKTICCGRPLLQQGFNAQATDLRRKNTNLINKSGALQLITSCPICCQSFKKEYKLQIEVLHHTEYIDRLIKQGKLNLEKSDLNIAYHDPCELGRGCGVYEEPRNVLKAVSNLMESKNNREKSICCGYNLGNTVIELEQQMKIRNASIDNLLAPNPDIIATACPMCKKAFSHATEYKVQDIAELVVNNLK